jgi:ketopantoate reductase
MEGKKPTIGIIGLGPVGSILAAHLAKSGEDVVVEDIVEELLRTINEEGLSYASRETEELCRWTVDRSR